MAQYFSNNVNILNSDLIEDIHFIFVIFVYHQSDVSARKLKV